MLYVFYNKRVFVGMPSAAATPTSDSEVDTVTKALLAVRLADNELTPATSAPLSITLDIDLHLLEPFLTPEANNMNADPAHLLDPLAIPEASNLDIGSNEGIPPVGNNHQVYGQGQGWAHGRGTSWGRGWGQAQVPAGNGERETPKEKLAAQVRKEVLSNGNGWSKLRSFTGLTFWIKILIAIFYQHKFAYNTFLSQLCPATKKSAPSEAEITNPKGVFLLTLGAQFLCSMCAGHSISPNTPACHPFKAVTQIPTLSTQSTTPSAKMAAATLSHQANLLQALTPHYFMTASGTLNMHTNLDFFCDNSYSHSDVGLLDTLTIKFFLLGVSGKKQSTKSLCFMNIF
ncbi:hypothetical protein BDP27DRAFT_1373317 [Rhodocollybia butyracea]|uniref:Uncharacterized protein n=1 Tax=Rhodocollybia butyracea TaxID=206335 RepID=A0A9P5P494_9AGAR|nr:hypothetical protein BDP27DRAFT_1373317 [Rhodocollybia butyracea]